VISSVPKKHREIQEQETRRKIGKGVRGLGFYLRQASRKPWVFPVFLLLFFVQRTIVLWTTFFFLVVLILLQTSSCQRGKALLKRRSEG